MWLFPQKSSYFFLLVIRMQPNFKHRKTSVKENYTSFVRYAFCLFLRYCLKKNINLQSGIHCYNAGKHLFASLNSKGIRINIYQVLH